MPLFNRDEIAFLDALDAEETAREAENAWQLQSMTAQLDGRPAPPRASMGVSGTSKLPGGTPKLPPKPLNLAIIGEAAKRHRTPHEPVSRPLPPPEGVDAAIRGDMTPSASGFGISRPIFRPNRSVGGGDTITGDPEELPTGTLKHLPKAWQDEASEAGKAIYEAAAGGSVSTLKGFGALTEFLGKHRWMVPGGGVGMALEKLIYGEDRTGKAIAARGRNAYDYWQEWEKRLKDKPRVSWMDDPRVLTDRDYWLRTVGEAVTSISSMFVGGAGTPVGMGILGGVVEAGPLYIDLLKEGRSEAEAATKALVFGTIVGVLNKIGAEWMFKGLAPGAVKSAGSAAAGALMETVMEMGEEPAEAAVRHFGRAPKDRETYGKLADATIRKLEDQGLPLTNYGREVLAAAVNSLEIAPSMLLASGFMAGGAGSASNRAYEQAKAEFDQKDANAFWYDLDESERLRKEAGPVETMLDTIFPPPGEVYVDEEGKQGVSLVSTLSTAEEDAFLDDIEAQAAKEAEDAGKVRSDQGQGKRKETGKKPGAPTVKAPGPKQQDKVGQNLQQPKEAGPAAGDTTQPAQVAGAQRFRDLVGGAGEIASPEDSPDQYVFHRGSDPRTATDVVLAADDRTRIESYGDNEYAIPRSMLEDVPAWAQRYAEQYYRGQHEDDYDKYLPPQVNPDDIVDTANVWDDQDFVSQFWQDNELRLLDMRDKGIFGFKTKDGAVLFPGDDIAQSWTSIDDVLVPTPPPSLPAQNDLEEKGVLPKRKKLEVTLDSLDRFLTDQHNRRKVVKDEPSFKREPGSFKGWAEQFIEAWNGKDAEWFRKTLMHGRGFNDGSKAAFFRALGKSVPKNRAAIGAAIDEWAGIPPEQRQAQESETQAKRDAAQAEKDREAAEKRDAEWKQSISGANAQRIIPYLQDMDARTRGAAIKALNKQFRFDGTVRTRREQAEHLIATGETTSTDEVDKIKAMSRRQWNRADQRQQDEHERRRKAAGKKTVYLVGGYDLGRTGYDYAEHLIANRPAAERFRALVGGEGERSADKTTAPPDSVAAGQAVETAPSEAQKDAGNYKMGHVKLDGLDITIENPVGSTRSGEDSKGRKWEQSLKSDYGYIRGTQGRDKDHVDVFVKPGYEGGADSVFVVNQVDQKTRKFDETKVMLGYDTAEEAKAAYLENYEKGWRGARDVIELPMERFKQWVFSSEEGPVKGALNLNRLPQIAPGAAKLKKGKKGRAPAAPAAAVPAEPVETPAKQTAGAKGQALKDQAKITKFRKMAGTLEQQVETKRAPMTQNPTPKRNREYRSRIHDADNLERLQKALTSMAAAIEAGTLPAVLEGLKTKAEIQSLVHKGIDTSAGGYYDVVPRQEYSDTSAAGKALQGMIEGAETPEGAEEREAREKAQNIEKLEDELRFVKVPGFFPTPEPLARRMVELAEIKPGNSILEPSGGIGSLADIIKEEHPDNPLGVMEVHPKMLQILREKEHNVVGEDFLESDYEADRVVMNPPFEKNQAIDHVEQAYETTRPGGIIVALIPGNQRTYADASQRKRAEFADWLDEVGAEWHEVPEGAFKGVQAFRQTGVSASIIKIRVGSAEEAMGESVDGDIVSGESEAPADLQSRLNRVQLAFEAAYDRPLLDDISRDFGNTEDDTKRFVDFLTTILAGEARLAGEVLAEDQIRDPAIREAYFEEREAERQEAEEKEQRERATATIKRLALARKGREEFSDPEMYDAFEAVIAELSDEAQERWELIAPVTVGRTRAGYIEYVPPELEEGESALTGIAEAKTIEELVALVPAVDIQDQMDKLQALQEQLRPVDEAYNNKIAEIGDYKINNDLLKKARRNQRYYGGGAAEMKKNIAKKHRDWLSDALAEKGRLGNQADELRDTIRTLEKATENDRLAHIIHDDTRSRIELLGSLDEWVMNKYGTAHDAVTAALQQEARDILTEEWEDITAAEMEELLPEVHGRLRGRVSRSGALMGIDLLETRRQEVIEALQTLIPQDYQTRMDGSLKADLNKVISTFRPNSVMDEPYAPLSPTDVADWKAALQAETKRIAAELEREAEEAQEKADAEEKKRLQRAAAAAKEVKKTLGGFKGAKKPIQLLKAAMPSTANLPVLRTVLVEAGVAHATDLDNTVSIPVDLKDGVYEIVGTQFVPSPIAADEWPSIPVIDATGGTVTFKNGQELLEAVRNAYAMSSTDESRYILNGALFEILDDGVMIVATDGRRETFQKIRADTAGMKAGAQFVLMDPALNLLLKDPKAETLRFAFGETQAQVDNGNMRLTTRLIEGTYPTWRGVVPAESTTSLRVDKKAMLDLLKSMKAFVKAGSASATDAWVVLSVKGTTLTVNYAASPNTAQYAQSGTVPAVIGPGAKTGISATVQMPGRGVGADEDSKTSVALNYHFLEDSINAVSGATVEIGMMDAMSPVVFQRPDQKEQFTPPPKDKKQPAAPKTPTGAAEAAVPGNLNFGETGEPTMPGQEGAPFPHVIEAPELLDIATALLHGRLPKLRRHLGNALGRFTYSTLNAEEVGIALKRDLWKGPLITGVTVKWNKAKETALELKAEAMRQYGLAEEEIIIVTRRGRKPGTSLVLLFAKDETYVNRTLAHEIGHLSDYLPLNTLTHGNLLGRIAGIVKGFRKHTLGTLVTDDPSGPMTGSLTEEDRRRLRQEARQQIQEEVRKAPAELIEEVLREVPVYEESGLTAEDIKSIWNSVSGGENNPQLLEYMKTLSDDQKKAILRKAMKGLVDEQLQKLGGRKIVGTRTVVEQRVVRPAQEVTPQNVKERFEALLREEMQKNMLYSLETVTRELRDLTQWWKPFNPTSSTRFTKYRFSSRELFADAISVLFNNPVELQRRAPTFYTAFFNWLGATPAVHQAYFEAQELIGNGGQLDKRVNALYEMQRRAQRRKLEHRTAAEKATNVPFWRVMVEELAARELPLWRLRRSYRRATGRAYDTSRDPLYRFEELPKINAVVGQMLRDVENDIQRILDGQGATREDLGVFLELRRAATERAHLANPMNIQGQVARDTLYSEHVGSLRNRLGQQRFEAVQQAAATFWAWRKKHVFPYLEKAGLFTPELTEHIRQNENYVRFSRIFDEGKREYAGIAGRVMYIHSQEGTLGDINNPFVETVLQDIAIVRSAQMNMAKNDLFTFLSELQRVDPNQDVVTPAKLRWDRGKEMYVIDEHKVPVGKALMVANVNGKPVGYYVSAEIAKMYERNPHGFMMSTKALNWLARPFKNIFVTQNPFWISRNIRKDWRGTIKRLRVNPFKLTGKYFRYMSDAYADVFLNQSTPIVREMLEEKMLIWGRTYRQTDPTSSLDDLEMLMGQFEQGHESHAAQRRATHGLKRLRSELLAHVNPSNWGQFSERLAKIAGYALLTDRGMEKMETGHVVRTIVGSPEFEQGGYLRPIYNALALFSNAKLRGHIAEVESYQRDPGGYLLRLAYYNILPKVLMRAAKLGVLGLVLKHLYGRRDDEDWLQRMFGKIPEHDLTHYNCVPIAEAKVPGTSKSECVYIIFPHDHSGEVVAGLAWKLMGFLSPKHARSGSTSEMVADTARFLRGQVPYGSLNPGVQLALDASFFMAGGTPIDDYYGTPIVSEAARREGPLSASAAKEFGAHALNQVSGPLVYRLKSAGRNRPQSKIGKALSWPVVQPLARSFVRVSRSGEISREYGAERLESQEKQRNLNKERDFIRKHIKKIKSEADFRVAEADGTVRELYDQSVAKGWREGSRSSYTGFRTRYHNLGVRRFDIED